MIRHLGTFLTASLELLPLRLRAKLLTTPRQKGRLQYTGKTADRTNDCSEDSRGWSA